MQSEMRWPVCSTVRGIGCLGNRGCGTGAVKLKRKGGEKIVVLDVHFKGCFRSGRADHEAGKV